MSFNWVSKSYDVHGIVPSENETKRAADYFLSDAHEDQRKHKYHQLSVMITVQFVTLDHC